MAVAPLLCVVALAAAACGSSSASGDDPIRIGVMAPTNNNVQSVPEVISAAKAAAEYINDEMDGINGDDVELKICETQQTPDSAVACANELLQENVVAVVPGGDLGMQQASKVFESAKIPMIGGIWYFPPELNFKYRKTMASATAGLGAGITAFAVKAFNAKKMALVTFEGSGVTVDPFYKTPLRELGSAASIDFIGVPPTATDLTPYFRAAASKNPDVVIFYALPCVPALQAFKASGSDAKVIQGNQCATDDTLKQAGSLANNNYFLYTNRNPTVHPTHPDVKVFQKAIGKYAPDEKHADTDFGLSEFQGVMNVAELARRIPAGKVTAATLQDEIDAARNRKNWLGLSGKYSCNPAPAKPYPALCNAEAGLALYRNGKFTSVKVDGKDYVDVAPLL